MENPKRNIAIVCGGDSSEHDVSMRSAQGLYSFFDKERYNVYIVDVKGLDWNVHFEDGTTAPIDKNDFSFLVNGKLVVFDYAEIASRIGWPCFVKPAADGSSIGISKVKNADQLAPALRVAFMESDEVMIERYLKGTEISVGCYKTKNKSVVFPATEVVTSNEFFDYDAKYNGQVEEITPARLNPETAERVAEETSKIYDILHCNGIIRIDYIISQDQNGRDVINMLEINSTPGMTATSFIPQQVKAAGLDIKDVLTDIIENQMS